MKKRKYSGEVISCLVVLILSSYFGNYAYSDEMYTYGQPGDIPVVGDWNGDGKDEIGVYRSPGRWYLDYNGNHIL